MTDLARHQSSQQGKQQSGKVLIIDLDKCDQCQHCAVRCDYYQRPQAQGHGILSLRERATFSLVCRRCLHASCIIACPFDAIERQEDGVIKRHNLRCVSCKLCAHACPFGTIYTETLTFYETRCDLCFGRNEAAPPCVASCSRGALEYRIPGPGEMDVHVIDDQLAARSARWVKDEVRT